MPSSALKKLVDGIQDDNAEVRTAAWLSAGEVGPEAVGPLAGLMGHQDTEVARAAKRGLWQLVRHVGRPKAEKERAAVAEKLLPFLAGGLSAVNRREIIWMLSEIGGAGAVGPLAALMDDGDVRDDARMALERIPGDGAVAALEAALKSAPGGLKPAIAHSLRQKGVAVEGYPSAHKIPVKPTNVKPL